MKKQLSEIDSLYENIISKSSIESRLEYCENLIDKAQSNITKNKKHIGDKLKEKLVEIITSAQNEIQKIDIEK